MIQEISCSSPTPSSRKLSFRIYGEPMAQGRPRAFTRPGMKGVRFYDPTPSKNWKMDVRHEVMRAGAQVLEGPIYMRLIFYLPRPKYLKDKVRAHVKKPDLDNLVKAVKDALKGVCWKDDSQVFDLKAEKHYTRPGQPEEMGIYILIEEVLTYG